MNLGNGWESHERTVARWEIGLRRVPELAARLVHYVAKEVRARTEEKKENVG